MLSVNFWVEIPGTVEFGFFALMILCRTWSTDSTGIDLSCVIGREEGSRARILTADRVEESGHLLSGLLRCRSREEGKQGPPGLVIIT